MYSLLVIEKIFINILRESVKVILIVNKTDSEGELTDWVRKELAEARQIPDSELISLEELEKMILEK